MKQATILFLLGLLVVSVACATNTTPAPGQTPINQTPAFLGGPTSTDVPMLVLPTLTPYPLNDPDLLKFKEQLKAALDANDPTALRDTISFSKWTGSLYRQGGTPPLDPRRGLDLTQEFLKENKVVTDIERPTYEPQWSMLGGDTSLLAFVTPSDGTEPYYAHFYISHEPSAWRYTGILAHIPYYDAPTVAQIFANPTKHAGKEYMMVGTYGGKTNPPVEAGAVVSDTAFILNTFAGPIWVAPKVTADTIPLPADADKRIGQPMRVFGTVTLKDGKPYLLSDSFQFIEPNDWAHVKGTVKAVDEKARAMELTVDGTGPSEIKLALTTYVQLPDETRGSLSDLKVGQKVDVTGVPQKDGALLAEEIFIAP